MKSKLVFKLNWEGLLESYKIKSKVTINLHSSTPSKHSTLIVTFLRKSKR